MKLKRCPSKVEIISFFEEKASARKGRNLLAHLRSCPECLAVFEAAKEIRSKSQEILRGLDGLDLERHEVRERLREEARREILLLRRTRRLKRRPALRWIGVPAVGAALALLAVFIIAPIVGSRRTSGGERNVSPLEIGLVRPKGMVPAAALSFVWTPRPEVQSYRLEIFDRGLEPVYQSGPLSVDTFSLPAEAAALIRKNEVYFWKIVAVFKDSRTIESEFARFILQN